MQTVRVLPDRLFGVNIHKFGLNVDVDAATAPEDIIAVGGSQYWPPSVVAAASINISSDDANDTILGSGLRTLLIEGLGDNHIIQTEIVELSGLAQVHPLNDYIRIYRISGLLAGTHANGNNVGNITIADGSGIMVYMPAGEGQSQQASYTVPAGPFSFGDIVQIQAALINKQAASATVKLRTREFGKAWKTRHVSGIGQNVNDITIPMALKTVPSRTDIVLMVASASADNLEIAGWFDVILR